MHVRPRPSSGRAHRQQSSLGLALLCIGGLVGSGVAAQARQDIAPPELHTPAPRPAAIVPIERKRGAPAADRAVATAVVDAIVDQFGDDPRVAVRLDRLAVDATSLRDRHVSGQGRLRIGDGGGWTPFRFEAMYDTGTADVGPPRLVLGDRADARTLAADSRLARALSGRAGVALAEEFGTQAVDLSLDRVTVVPVGDDFLALRAIGHAAFEGEGGTPARVRALYERRSGQWLRVEYELGGSAVGTEAVPPALTRAAG